MELIKEYLDEKTNKYVLEFNATAEEKEALETKCHELNLTVDELAEKSLRWCIDNPDKFKKWIIIRKFTHTQHLLFFRHRYLSYILKTSYYFPCVFHYQEKQVKEYLLSYLPFWKNCPFQVLQLYIFLHLYTL